jgi:hypothetical protein
VTPGSGVWFGSGDGGGVEGSTVGCGSGVVSAGGWLAEFVVESVVWLPDDDCWVPGLDDEVGGVLAVGVVLLWECVAGVVEPAAGLLFVDAGLSAGSEVFGAPADFCSPVILFASGCV